MLAKCLQAVILFGILNLVAVSISAQTASPKSFPVVININASQTMGELKPIWRFFGADEPNYAYMKDGKKNGNDRVLLSVADTQPSRYRSRF